MWSVRKDRKGRRMQQAVLPSPLSSWSVAHRACPRVRPQSILPAFLLDCKVFFWPLIPRAVSKTSLGPIIAAVKFGSGPAMFFWKTIMQIYFYWTNLKYSRFQMFIFFFQIDYPKLFFSSWNVLFFCQTMEKQLGKIKRLTFSKVKEYFWQKQWKKQLAKKTWLWSGLTCFDQILFFLDGKWKKWRHKKNKKSDQIWSNLQKSD